MLSMFTNSGAQNGILELLSHLPPQKRLASCRFAAFWSLLLVGFVGCAHTDTTAVVPTAAALLEVRQLHAPAPPGFAPQARIVVSRALAAQEVQRVVDDRLRVLADVAVDVPFLGTMHLRPTARVQSVDAEHGADCDGCLLLTIDVDGLLLPTDAPVAPVNFRGRLHGAVAVALQRHDDGVVDVVATPMRLPVDDNGWQVDVEVDGLGGLAPMVSDIAQRRLRQLVLEGDAQHLVLATLPSTLAKQIRGLRADARVGAIVVDLALVALHPGVVADDAPIVDEGFSLLVPDDTLRGVANAALLQDTEHLPAGWSVWSTGLVIDGDRFIFALEAWHDHDARAYALEAQGRFLLDDAGTFHVDVDAVRHAEPRDFNALDPVVRAALEHETIRALEQASVAPMPLADGRVLLLTSIIDRGAMLELRGNVVTAAAP
jgi:hypothetical protein